MSKNEKWVVAILLILGLAVIVSLALASLQGLCLDARAQDHALGIEPTKCWLPFGR